MILYADRVTDSMNTAMEETNRRREKQLAFNREHGIIPETVRKNLDTALGSLYAEADGGARVAMAAEDTAEYVRSPKKLATEIRRLEREMRQAASELAFERAATLRDRIAELREMGLELS